MSPEPSVGTVLERDHRDIDAHFAAFRTALHDGRIEAARFRSGADELRHHIWVEEEYHFPPLRAAGLMGPVLVMLKEHGELWDLLDEVEAQVTDGAAAEAVARTFSQVERIVNEHNFKEERILYPSGDAQLDEDTSAEILTALRSGERPQDWAAQMAGRG